MVYMLTFTINIPPMLAYIPYMDPMGIVFIVHFSGMINIDEPYLNTGHHIVLGHA